MGHRPRENGKSTNVWRGGGVTDTPLKSEGELVGRGCPHSGAFFPRLKSKPFFAMRYEKCGETDRVFFWRKSLVFLFLSDVNDTRQIILINVGVKKSEEYFQVPESGSAEI